MKPTHIVGLIVWSIALTAGGMAGGYFLAGINDEEPEEVASVVAPTQNSEGSQLGVSNSNVGQLGGTAGTDTPTGPGSGASTLLDPSDFEQYEQYANERNVLYAETQLGTGEPAAQGDDLAAVYTGWLTDGTVFDQSKKDDDGRLAAFTFTLGAGQVIPGWEQGFEGMQVGGKRRLIVPASAGYGDQKKANIPPNSMLIFDVELLKITKPKTQEAPTPDPESTPQPGL